MSLTGIASNTVAISQRGTYTAEDGSSVDIRTQLQAAVAGTELYRPADFEALRVTDVARASMPTRFEVTDETTGAAGRRLVEREGERGVVALNFASARNPGGGFLGGAKAQEEDLARCSGLYVCQLTTPAYYAANRAQASMLYTDHLIYSPEVPFFRDEDHALLAAPFLLSIITSPAPNAGEAVRNGRAEGHLVPAALARRAKQVLTVAATKGHRVLVLGAWGCGVFRNEPRRVAETFFDLLRSPDFAGVFDRVVFPIYDRSRPSATRRAFEEAAGLA